MRKVPALTKRHTYGTHVNDNVSSSDLVAVPPSAGPHESHR